MIKGEIIYTNNSEEFGIEISNIIIKIIDDCITDKGQCFMAVSGGSTPIPVFKALTGKNNQNIIKWSGVHVFFIDERCVPNDHQDNNFNSCYELWLQHYPEIKYYRIKGWLDPIKAAQQYENETLSIFDKKNGLPQFDLIFMGVGEDGHIASLFPEYDFSKVSVFCMEYIHIKSKDMHRITMTLPILNNAKNRIIGIVGQKKKKIFNELMNSDYKNYPVAQLLSSNSNDIWVIN